MKPQRNGNKPDGDDDQRRLAVLIDADNAQASVIEGLLAEVAKFGRATVKRIYGDFTSQRLASWKDVLLKHSIQPIQQYAYTSGKNATDSSLIIDAMDLLYTQRLDGFCLVTSDSDFTRLAQRLREEGLTVYGFGERKTPDAFVQACDKFIYTEVLRRQDPGKALASPQATAASTAAKAGGQSATPPAKKAAAKTAPKSGSAKVEPKPGNAKADPGGRGAVLASESNKAGAVGDLAAPPQAKATSVTEATDVNAPPPEAGSPLPSPRELLEQAIDECSDEQGWAHLGQVGSYLTKLRPDFDARLYGHKKLRDLVRAYPKSFELQERGDGAGKAVFARVKH